MREKDKALESKEAVETGASIMQEVTQVVSDFSAGMAKFVQELTVLEMALGLIIFVVGIILLYLRGKVNSNIVNKRKNNFRF